MLLTLSQRKKELVLESLEKRRLLLGKLVDKMLKEGQTEATRVVYHDIKLIEEVEEAIQQG